MKGGRWKAEYREDFNGGLKEMIRTGARGLDLPIDEIGASEEVSRFSSSKNLQKVKN